MLALIPMITLQLEDVSFIPNELTRSSINTKDGKGFYKIERERGREDEGEVQGREGECVNLRTLTKGKETSQRDAR